MAKEHLINLRNGAEEVRDAEESGAAITPADEEKLQRRREALARLHRAALESTDIADLLTLLGEDQ